MSQENEVSARLHTTHRNCTPNRKLNLRQFGNNTGHMSSGSISKWRSGFESLLLDFRRLSVTVWPSCLAGCVFLENCFLSCDFFWDSSTGGWAHHSMCGFCRSPGLRISLLDPTNNNSNNSLEKRCKYFRYL